MTQRELHQIEGYELAHQARRTVLAETEALRGGEPWPGYDEWNADEVAPYLRELDGETRGKVHEYEVRHRNRDTITTISGD